MLIMNHPCSLPDDIPSARYAMKPREINTENNADLDRGRRFVYVKFEYMPSPLTVFGTMGGIFALPRL